MDRVDAGTLTLAAARIESELMWKKLLALAVTAGIIGGSMYLYRHRHTLFRPDFARAGGTALVYEVEGQPSREDLDEAAAVLRRRFDPTGALGLLTRVTDQGELELSVPHSDKHDSLVDQIKRLVHHTGRLEIRVLPRQSDGESAFAAATDALKEPGAKDKVPPPSPPNPEAAAKLTGDADYRHTWARLSVHELRLLRLDPTVLTHHNHLDLPRVTEALKTGEALVGLSMAPTLLFAVRQVPGEKDPAFYVLTREEPASRRILGEHIERTWVSTDPYNPGRFAVTARFTREGGDRLFQVTSRNLTVAYDMEGKKKLAVLLDGEVVSTPAIMSASRKDLQFPGDFMKAQAEDLAVLVRGGACPVRLKPVPLRETNVQIK